MTVHPVHTIRLHFVPRDTVLGQVQAVGVVREACKRASRSSAESCFGKVGKPRTGTLCKSHLLLALVVAAYSLLVKDLIAAAGK